MDLTTVLILAKYACFAAFPAIGFGMVFNVPLRALKFCALGGAVAHTTRTFFFAFWRLTCICLFLCGFSGGFFKCVLG